MYTKRDIPIIFGVLLLGVSITCTEIVDNKNNLRTYYLDEAFGVHGIAQVKTYEHTGSYNIYIPDVHGLIQPDGKIVVVGNHYKANLHEQDYPQAQIIVARYNPDGSPDITFGENGYCLLSLSQKNSFAMDIALQRNGKLVIAGRRFDRGDWLGEAVLSRIHGDGTVDTSFGDNGVTILSSYGLTYSNCFRMRLRNDDTIVICGNLGFYRPIANVVSHNNTSFIQHHAFEHSGFCVAQLSADGIFDAQFGANGIVLTYLQDTARTKLRIPGREDDNAHSLCIQQDGNIVVVGGMADGSDPDLLCSETPVISTETGLAQERSTLISNTTDCALARYDFAGNLDTTFGPHHTGMIMNSLSEKYNVFLDCTTQPDSKILALGIVRNALHDIDQLLLVRYLHHGILDHTFGMQGVVTMSIGTGDARPKNIIVQDDGTIMVTGIFRWGDYDKFTLIRYRENGSIDDTFGDHGIMILPIGLYHDRSLALISHNYDLFVVGDSYDGTRYHMTVAKLAT